MFSCHACLRKCLDTFVARELGGSASFNLRRRVGRGYDRASWLRGRYAGLRTSSGISPRSELGPRSRSLPRPRDGDKGAAAAPQSQPQENEEEGGQLIPTRSFPRKAATQLELQYLLDPLKLGDHVQRTLRGGDPNKAVELVRHASNTMSCTVSWNHVMDYQMYRGMVKAAFKSYNEMKKRGQIPDAYTYTILLRGLANHAEYPSAVSKALSLFQAMHDDRSHVDPSIIHTNAVLKVCARARDMDALWGVAAKLPQHGMGAADSVTYTTLLNAIQREATEYIPQESLWARRGRKSRAVLEGRKMWDDVGTKWAAGELQMDEDLVCAMARLLLVGRYAMDWDDVLSLVKQTMDVPRLAERVGEKNAAKENRREVVEGAMLKAEALRRGPASAISENETHVEGKEDESLDVEKSAEASDEEGALVQHQAEDWKMEDGKNEDERDVEPEHDDLFERPLINLAEGRKVLQQPRSMKSGVRNPRGKAQFISYARPGTNTLSVVLDACGAAHTAPAARAYWDFFTTKTDLPGSGVVKPDLDNYHAYLRVLRSTRSSKRALEIVRDQLLADKDIAPQRKTFQIAMSICGRDKLNPKAIDHADELVKLMHQSLADPDIPTLVGYANLAIYATPGASISERPAITSRPAGAASEIPQPGPLLRVFDRMMPIIANLKSMMLYGQASDLEKPKEYERDNAAQLIHKMLGIFDRLQNMQRRGGSEMLPYQRRMKKLLDDREQLLKFYNRTLKAGGGAAREGSEGSEGRGFQGLRRGGGERRERAAT
ncbi:MAG: Kynureninase (L-kynurenine hydrolase) [Chaenotheca gracillima]|nr:MAG: Kynureninase (L-kynurenine hydrolase) [Chaenotheca gracillima]